jgi:hypothetical protein
LIGLDILLEDQLPGIGALDPEIVRGLTLEKRLDLGQNPV